MNISAMPVSCTLIVGTDATCYYIQNKSQTWQPSSCAKCDLVERKTKKKGSTGLVVTSPTSSRSNIIKELNSSFN